MNKIKAGFGWPYEVTKKDIRIEFFRGGGTGGQNKNKRDTACRMTHIPTGISAQAQEHRTQERNKITAFNRLAALLVPKMKELCKRNQIENQIIQERIRTYKEKNGLVIDDRITEKTYDYSTILDGELEELIEDLKKANK